MSNIFRPDFIQIPTQVLTDKSLQPLDRILFGYIYWFTKLKDGQCTASNNTLAELTNTTSDTIKNSLNRLTKSGWITKVMRNKNFRKEIKCNLSYGKDGSLKSNRELWKNPPQRNQMIALAKSNDCTSQKNLQRKVKSNDAHNNIEKEYKRAYGTPHVEPRVPKPTKPAPESIRRIQQRIDEILRSRRSTNPNDAQSMFSDI